MSGFTKAHQKIVLTAIKKYFPKAEVMLFGSRKGNSFRKDSDLDLLIDTHEDNDFSKNGKLRDELEEDTRLPYRVDLVFRDQISEGFLSLIRADCDKW